MNALLAQAKQIFLTPIIRFIDQIGGILGLLVFSLRELLFIKGPDSDVIYEETVKQVYGAGVSSFPLIAVISIALGFLTNFSMQAFALGFLGAEMVSQIMIIVIVRELGPLLTAIVLIARSGTAISAEIGAIVVGHELESLESIGVDPLRLIVLPRILGLMISMFILNLFFDAIGIIGGLLVTKLLSPDIVFISFLRTFFNVFSLTDIMIIVIKSMVLGALVSVTSVYFGFKISGATSAIAEVAKKGVVNGFFWVFLFNALITALFWISQG